MGWWLSGNGGQWHICIRRARKIQIASPMPAVIAHERSAHNVSSTGIILGSSSSPRSCRRLLCGGRAHHTVRELLVLSPSLPFLLVRVSSPSIVKSTYLLPSCWPGQHLLPVFSTRMRDFCCYSLW